MESARINVEVAFAEAEKQRLITINVPYGVTIKEAIILSNILKEFPQINLEINKIGIFSQFTTLDCIVQAGDRIEIYLPLLVDPKQARLKRANKQ